jgi:hypothetical protein
MNDPPLSLFSSAAGLEGIKICYTSIKFIATGLLANSDKDSMAIARLRECDRAGLRLPINVQSVEHKF